MTLSESVEFKSVDGVVLRGVVYPAYERGPGIILSPAFNAVKEMLGLPDTAMAFQKAGITALLFDCRSTGSSDGEPRNDIDPWKQTEDYFDAVSFLKNHTAVDHRKIFLWGMSLSGAVALTAASLDQRIAGVLCVCPIVELQYDQSKLPQVMSKCLQDRESQVKGNKPFYLPILTSEGENPAGLSTGVDKEHYAKLVANEHSLAPTHVNRTTIQSYLKNIMWRPSSLWRLIKVPVLFVVPELDSTCPAELQLRYFEDLSAPKRAWTCPGKSHMDILEGDSFSEVLNNQTEFVWAVINGEIQQH